MKDSSVGLLLLLRDMNYKIIILAPSAGGKSTLMRYLRKHTQLSIAEMDEEVMKANGNKWPSDDNYKNQVLVPKVTENIMKSERVIYIASFVPEDLIRKAKDNEFKVILLELSLEQLQERNTERMKTEGYADTSPWFQVQLEGYKKLSDSALADIVINGNQPTSEIASEVIKIAQQSTG